VLLLPDLGLLPPVFLDTLPLRLAHERMSVLAPLALVHNFTIMVRTQQATHARYDTEEKAVVRVRTCPSTKTCTAGVSHCRLSEMCAAARGW
jgi:hypothetical protein